MSHRFYVPPTRFDKLEQSQYAMTLEEIGQVLGVSRERVRQIEQKALRKLRGRCMPQLLAMRDLANDLRRNSGTAEHGVIR